MNETTLKIFNRTLHIKKQWKITFLATWIGGMLAHAYRFFNFLPSWDSMYNFAGTGATYSSGRCFLEFFSKISSKYDMPWVNGALSLLYISLASILLVELFELQECASCVLLALLIVSFPTVTASFVTSDSPIFSISVFSISPVSNSALEPAGRYPSVGCDRYCSIRFASSYEYGISRFCNTFFCKVTPLSCIFCHSCFYPVRSVTGTVTYFFTIEFIFSVIFCRISLFLSSASSVSLAWADTSSVVAEIV